MHKQSSDPCYFGHPPLPLKDGLVVYGGSCGHPIVKDADIYVGFDRSMDVGPMSWPWNAGESFLYPITDMSVPKDLGSFNSLIDWLAVQLAAKKKVHLGCIGGHGRTGTVMAALVKVMTGEKAAIEYVRANYCTRAVESLVQVDFLAQHFGIDRAEATKTYVPRYVRPVVQSTRSIGREPFYVPPVDTRPSGRAAFVKNRHSIWGDVKLTNAPKSDTIGSAS